VADSGENGVGGIALAAFEIAAAGMTIDLHVADHGLDAQLAFDEAGDAAPLAGDEDAVRIGGGVAAIALLWQIEFMQQSCTETFSAVRASLKRSHDAVDDGVTHGRQAWLRWRSVDSFFPASLE
jgi:hypothetical protein